MNTERASSTKSKGWVYAILGLLALIIIGLSIWLISVKGDLKQKEQQEADLKAYFEAEVDSLIRVHNSLKENYGDLSLQLAEKDSIILADAEEIKKLLDSKQDAEQKYIRIQKRMNELENISRHYIQQLDSLYKVNDELIAENERIREEVQEERRQNRNLQRQKEELTTKVNMATVLHIYNLSAEAVRFKGGTQETETDKAGRTERIRVTFTIGQNDLIEPGPKDFYMRIADPSKSIITKGMGDEYAFMYHGELLQYTEKIHVSYENREKEVRAYYIKPSGKEMQPGYYFVDIYDDNDNLIGQTSFNLR